MNKRNTKKKHFYKALGAVKGYRLAYPSLRAFLFSREKQ